MKPAIIVLEAFATAVVLVYFMTDPWWRTVTGSFVLVAIIACILLCAFFYGLIKSNEYK